MIKHPDQPTLAEAEEDDRICGKPVISAELQAQLDQWWEEDVRKPLTTTANQV